MQAYAPVGGRRTGRAPGLAMVCGCRSPWPLGTHTRGLLSDSGLGAGVGEGEGECDGVDEGVGVGEGEGEGESEGEG